MFVICVTNTCQEVPSMYLINSFGREDDNFIIGTYQTGCKHDFLTVMNISDTLL